MGNKIFYKLLISWLLVLTLGWGGFSPAAQALLAPGTENPPASGETSGTENPPASGETSGTEETPASGETSGTENPPALGETSGTENPPASGETSGTEETPDIESYTVTLGSCVIGDGESRSYTTVSSAFAGEDITADGYYPGNLTVEVTGQIVIEAGGFLGIGALSIGGPEASPVVTGACREDGLIVVKAGGQLKLTEVTLQTIGEGFLIVQEPGGSIELSATELEEGLVQWAPPLVENQYDSPDDLWLEEGTRLMQDMLPESLRVNVQSQGTSERREVPLSWNLQDYDGRTSGELVLEGTFLDEEGNAMPSLLPLELTVHWYTPEKLIVTKAVWKGDQVPTVQLTVQNLPEDVDVWGETSLDGGRTWERWEDETSFFLVKEDQDEATVCVFVLQDARPRLFRIAAEDSWFHEYWRSEARFLYPEEFDDSGGNRGGSVSPIAPDREPEPEPEPEQAPEQNPEPESEQELELEPEQAPEQESEPALMPEQEPAPEPESETNPEGEEESESATVPGMESGWEITVQPAEEPRLESTSAVSNPEEPDTADAAAGETAQESTSDSVGTASESEQEPAPEPETSETSKPEEPAIQPDQATQAESPVVVQAESQQEGPPSVLLQTLLVLGGLGVCAAAGILSVRLSQRKK